jgi:hypothetical protein
VVQHRSSQHAARKLRVPGKCAGVLSSVAIADWHVDIYFGQETWAHMNHGPMRGKESSHHSTAMVRDWHLFDRGLRHAAGEDATVDLGFVTPDPDFTTKFADGSARHHSAVRARVSPAQLGIASQMRTLSDVAVHQKCARITSTKGRCLLAVMFVSDRAIPALFPASSRHSMRAQGTLSGRSRCASSSYPSRTSSSGSSDASWMRCAGGGGSHAQLIMELKFF